MVKAFQINYWKKFLNKTERKSLIRLWEKDPRETGHIPPKQKNCVIDHAYKWRYDVRVTDIELDSKLKLKVAEYHPISENYWNSNTKREEFRVGGYLPNGHFAAHRDNDGPLIKDRKYGFVAALNDPNEYEGGDLVFPELGITTRLPAGDAIVFNAGLLHQVTPVTSGTRFVLINFFY